MITEIMKKEHVSQIAQLEKDVFGAENAEKTLLKELENKISTYFVATENKEILGYIGLWNICGEGDIINIAVCPDKRRLGIATMLIEKVFELCRKNNISVLNLEVRESNIAARELYKKLGFIEVGERKRYYDGKETAVLMKKEINSEVL